MCGERHHNQLKSADHSNTDRYKRLKKCKPLLLLSEATETQLQNAINTYQEYAVRESLCVWIHVQ